MSSISKHRWQFKSRFTTGSYGWRGTAIASKRLREAVSEIRKVAKADPILAADGVVGLMERLYPALQNIDSSSGTLGNAVHKTLHALLPILIESGADIATRRKWLARLYQAVIDDGVNYLTPVEERWGEISGFPELVTEWADRLVPGLHEHLSERKTGHYYRGTDICLSCLLQANRFDELKEILNLRGYAFWPYDKFWAEALVRQERFDEAISYAESLQADDDSRCEIIEFCERILLETGRREEAYERYGLATRSGTTYLAQYKSIVKKYPEREPRQILLDLVCNTDNKAAWFASARQSGFLDIALDCAKAGYVDPKTLMRASRDTADSDPQFAAHVALRAIDLLLEGRGYEKTIIDPQNAFRHLMTAARNMDAIDSAIQELKALINREPPNYDNVSQKILENLLKIELDRQMGAYTKNSDID